MGYYILNTVFEKKELIKLHKYNNAVILPRKEVKDGPMWGLGGVCDENNDFVKESFYDGGWATHGGKYEWYTNSEIRIEKQVIYVGLLCVNHWGHFIIDSITRFWGILEVKKSISDFNIGYIGETEIGGNYLHLLELLGVQKEQLIRITKPTRCSEVIVPGQAFKSCEWYFDEHVKMFDYIVSIALENNEKFEELKQIKKVYFTRRRLGKAVSDEFGEEYIEKCFTQNGYMAISPELLSLEEQIYIWNNADEIVCINGTIPLNVIFSRKRDLKVIVLNKTSIVHENPYILFEMRGVEAKYINIYREPFKNYPKSLGEGPYLITEYSAINELCKEREFNLPMSKEDTDKYIKEQQRKYIFAVIGIKRRYLKLKYKLYLLLKGH